VTAFPTITALTPVNDAAILDEIFVALDERWRAAGLPRYTAPGYPPYAPSRVWGKIGLAEALTVTGAYGVAQTVGGQISGDGTPGPYRCRIVPVAFLPVKPNTVRIDALDAGSAIEQTLSDDGNGNLSDGDDGAGRINYSTGWAEFTFTDPASFGIQARFDSAWTRLDCDQDPPGRFQWFDWSGRRLVVAGAGTFTILQSGDTYAVVSGDASCTAAAYSVAAGGNVIDSGFWAAWQECILTLIPYYLNIHAWGGGFEGEAALHFFGVGQPDYLEEAGLIDFPRRVPARGPCTLIYDEEADTTAVHDTSDSEDYEFVAGHEGMRLDVFGVGQFVIASVDDNRTVTLGGRVEHGGASAVVSVLPDDPLDQADPAFIYGLCQTGDVMGPWLMADLILAMGPLAETTSAEGCTALWGQEEADANTKTGEGDDLHLADAKSAAQAAYASASPAHASTVPYAVSRISTGSGPGWYNASLWRAMARGYWHAPEDSAPLPFDVDFYAIPARPAYGSGFAGNGDFTVEGVLHLCLTETDIEDRTGLTAAEFGSLTQPVWEPGGIVGSLYGYEVPAPAAVYRWHFTHTP
jgi:hypothetical protein